MKKRIIWLSLALGVGSASHAFAQGASDALQYSRLQFGGPARTQGIGGANVALGADFGNLTSNPAGLGMYQKSEAHITPGLGLGRGEGSIEGGTSAKQSQDKNSFHIGSAGLVLATRRPDNDQSSNWRGGAFALGFSRLADFNSASRYQGSINNNQSYLSRLQPDASVRGQDFFNSLDKQVNDNSYTSRLGLAYGAYLANIVTARNGTDSAVVLRRQGNVLNQREVIINSGSVSQFDLGYGANYRDRLYIGGAIGIVSSNYTQTRTLIEADNDLNTHFNSLTNQTELKTTGAGFNARLGLIYRATDVVRVGASIQTPTFLRLTDTFSESLTSNFSAQGTDRVPQPGFPVGDTRVGRDYPAFTYNLTTPFRANGGAAITLGKYGFVTGDVEYVGYGQARLRTETPNVDDDAAFAIENSNIQARYKSTVNVRFGAEGRFDIFRARLGYARYGDPYKADTNNERVQNFYTAGLGLRQGNFFLDAATVYTTLAQLYTPYSLPNGLQPVINVNTNRFTTSLTAGLTF